MRNAHCNKVVYEFVSYLKPASEPVLSVGPGYCLEPEHWNTTMCHQHSCFVFALANIATAIFSYYHCNIRI